MPARLLALALLLHPAPREPLDTREIAELGETRDIWRVPELEAIFDGRWARLAHFPASLPPPELERELVAALEALTKLDASAAARKAKIVLARETSLPIGRAARRALAATGALEAVRRELLDFFLDERGSKEALSSAAAATEDVRLRDFREPGDAPRPDPRSLVERNLAAATESRTVRVLLAAGAPPRVIGALAPSALDEGIERALKRALASPSEEEALDALEALAARGALGARELETLLDDERSAVRALAARFGNDADVLRERLLSDASEPFFSEAVRSIVRLEGGDGSHELAPWARGRGFRATLAVVDGLEDIGVARELTLALRGEERARLLRVLAEEDRAVLMDVPLTAEDVDQLYPYLARSRYPVLREQLTHAHRARGPALASGLLSTNASDEEKRALLEAMPDAWSSAIVSGGASVVARLEALAGAEAVDRFLVETPLGEDFVAALALLPTSRARLRLQAIGSAGAVCAIVARADRILSLPALTALASDADSRASDAARLAVVRLGGAGANAFLRSLLASGAQVPLLAAVLQSPLDPRLIETTIERFASSAERSPEALAALFQFHERDPGSFLALASEGAGPLSERASFALSLSEKSTRIPLLVDRAVGLGNAASQEAALLGLSERDLGSFGQRLHRLAGDVDHRVRFLAAAALVPSGEPWAMRLLVAELDVRDRFERQRAAAALGRLDDARARPLLEAMVEDGTAGAFSLGALIDRSPDARRNDRAFQRRAWALLKADVELGEIEALLVASRLSEPAAVTAVVAWLRAR